jgi:D-alanine-D-alanine ligase
MNGLTKMKDHHWVRNDFQPDESLPFQSIGIVYCTSQLTVKGREIEKVADCEVVEVARAVQAVLQEKGYFATPIDLNLDQISRLCQYDWIINLAETIYGFPLTDYEIAEQMERLNIHFTGSGSQALRLCLDKAVTKAKLIQYGVNTPVYDVFYPGDQIQTKCRYPAIVKPVHEDGSIGITNNSIARNDIELALRVEEIHRVYHQAALVEEFINGRDITASILGNGDDTVVLPLSEIAYPSQFGSKFLTFEAKWLSGSLDYQTSVAICPPVLDPTVELRIKQIALEAYHIMGCRDYARVDFRLRDDNPYVLEVNPNPCINPNDSGFVRCGKVAGFQYADLIHQILKQSMKARTKSRNMPVFSCL